MAKRRYLLELTEHQIGILNMALEITEMDMHGNKSYNRILPYVEKLKSQISEVRNSGMKTVKN